MRKVAFFVALVFAGSAEQLPVRHYTTADGLAGNRIHCILRDSHGFLWFCTSEGLSRFDGYQFTNLTDAQGLPRNNVFDMLETREGTYWVGTSAGPVRYDPARAESGTRFTLYSVGRRAAVVLLEDHSGAIWCGTSSYRGGTWSLT